ncbi:1,5-anhydro-D-fructose reductase-like [Anthonomus grandis grandis]|uniref:1,5-anhydro-D-fructose reductase-like n=1 Tax=Anthonomus grandis grandis TaxID=2921223 RepID=UPI0021657093|nr:1,5-anhydro-D-fructose reductase-like [Anthonomus grandis grandis]
MKTVRLVSSGLEMPIVGLGTWRAQPQEVESAVNAALECGYRHIDTAFNYNTEEPIGNVLKAWLDSGKLKREDLFITTKLPNFGNRPSDVERFLNLSLEKLQLSYVDLYLMHMPFSFHLNEATMAPLINEDGSFSLDLVDYVDTWKVMQKQVEQGKVRSIGVSNFNAEQLRRLHDCAEIKPEVLQVEMHAYLQQKNLRQLCQSLNVAVTAYSPLGSPGANSHFSAKYNYSLNDFPDILGHPLVKELAEKYSKSPGQILLRHLTQENVIVIPKSGNPERIKANLDIFDFELEQEDLTKLDQLDKGENGRIFNFLFFKGVENHPCYPFKKPEEVLERQEEREGSTKQL